MEKDIEKLDGSAAVDRSATSKSSISSDLVEVALDAEANVENKHNSDKIAITSPYAAPPNGGLLAWTQVLGSFFLFCNSWGLVNSFGVFQSYYENNPYWSATPSDISWIGSLQAFLLMTVGVITGPLYDMGYFKHIIVTGTILVTFGFMMTSLCREYWQCVIAQGIVIGIGNGCLFVPAVAILPQYFSTRKAFANGLAASGSSIGGVVYTIAFSRLLKQVGYPWATRVIGFIALAGLSFSCIAMKPRARPKGRRKLVQLAAFKEAPYTLFTIAMLFVFMGFYGPFYYIQTFAVRSGITNTSLGFYILPIVNAASVPGRILPNFITDYIGPLNVLVPAALVTSILAFCWIAVHNLTGLVLFAVFYGFFSGAFVSLPPVALTTLTKDLSSLGTRMGQMFFVSAFGLLIGTPVSGAILSASGGFLGVQLFSACTIFVTFVLASLARIKAVGLKPWTVA